MMNPYNRIWLKIIRRVHSSSSGDQQTHALMYILCFISSVYRFVICFEQHLKLGVFILCMYYLIGKRELAHMHFTHYISKWPYTQHSKISAIIEHQKLPQTSNTPSTCWVHQLQQSKVEAPLVSSYIDRSHPWMHLDHTFEHPARSTLSTYINGLPTCGQRIANGLPTDCQRIYNGFTCYEIHFCVPIIQLWNELVTYVLSVRTLWTWCLIL